MKGFTTREVADVLGLTQGQVRSYARSGLLAPGRGPRNHYRFSFQDIVVLRTTRELLAAHVDLRRVRRSLNRLKTQLPRGRHMSAVRITAEGDRVVVYDDGTIWEPESGQVCFDFSVAELATRAEPFAHDVVRRPSEDENEAEHWFDVGMDMEAVAPVEARAAYERAVQLDPRHAGAHLNLGRIVHEEGDLAAAEAHYRRAAEADPEDALAAHNLGVVLEDRGQKQAAMQAYRGAVRLDPAHADAHYNLADLLEGAGDAEGAIRHLAFYRTLTRDARDEQDARHTRHTRDSEPK